MLSVTEPSLTLYLPADLVYAIRRQAGEVEPIRPIRR